MKKEQIFRFLILAGVLILVTAGTFWFTVSTKNGNQNLKGVTTVNNIDNNDNGENFGQLLENRSENENQAGNTPKSRPATKVTELLSDFPEGVRTARLQSVQDPQKSVDVIGVSNKGAFVLAVEATLPDLSGSGEYFAWLAKEANSANPLKLGKLEKKNGKNILSFEQQGDFSAYKILLITKEINNDNQPEERILEGEF